MRTSTPPLPLLFPLLIACSFTGGCASPHSSTLPPPAQLLDEHIRLHAASAQTQEFPVARIFTEGDLNQDGIPDLVLVYRLEGNPVNPGFQQFLTAAVSHSAQRRPQIARAVLVGTHDQRSISGLRVLPGTVELNTVEYLPTDASCCPTGRGVQSWSWDKQHQFQPLFPSSSPNPPSSHKEVTK